jgi:hypothetical protein
VKLEKLVHFLQESMRAVHPLSNSAKDFDHADHTERLTIYSNAVSFEIQSISKFMANLNV